LEAVLGLGWGVKRSQRWASRGLGTQAATRGQEGGGGGSGWGRRGGESSDLPSLGQTL